VEFDLEGFFNNLSLRAISEALLDEGIPKSLVSFINRINTTIPLSKEFKNDYEKEMKRVVIGLEHTFIKKGMPQGLP